MVKKRRSIPAGPVVKKPRRKRDLDKQIGFSLFDDFDKFEQFFLTHWKKFCFAGGAIVVLAAVWGIGSLIQQNSNNKAVTALNSASSMEELVAAIDEFGDSKIANEARLRLVTMLESAGNYDDAIAQLDAVLDSDCPDEQRAQAAISRAYLMERAGKVSEAAAVFAEIAQDPNLPVQEYAAQAYYNAGRLYLSLGDNANAVKYLNKARAGLKFAEAQAGMQDPFRDAMAAKLLDQINSAPAAAATEK